MTRFLTAAAWLTLTLWLGGCSTMRGDFHQILQVDALDAHNRPVEGMHCEVGSGSSAKKFVTPAMEVRVRRAMEPLSIECRLDNMIATATVKPRRERMEEALLPFGSVGVFVDHLSGSLYAYPTALHLRVGQHLVLEHGGEARVAGAEPVQATPQPATASVQHAQVAVAQPVAATAPAKTDAAAPASRKPAAPAAKAERAATKPSKTTSVASTAATTKPKTAASKAAVVTTTAAATAAAAGAAAAVHAAPVNW